MGVHLLLGPGIQEQIRNARVVIISRNAGVVVAESHVRMDMIITLPYMSFTQRS